MRSKSLAAKLKKYWVSTQERCGVITAEGKIVELKNASSTPTLQFRMLADDVTKYRDTMQATWHTHPTTSANLSVDDWVMFRQFPNAMHYIVAEHSTRSYVVKDGKVLIHEEDCV